MATKSAIDNPGRGSSSNTAPITLPAISRYTGSVDDTHRPGNQSLSLMENTFEDVQMHGTEYLDHDGNEMQFSAGNVLDRIADARHDLHEQIESIGLLEDHTIFGQMSTSITDMDVLDEDDTNVTALETAFQLLGIDDLEEGEEDPFVPEEDMEASSNDEWKPHGSKTMFMVDLLDNLPRLRLSDDQLKAILWVMRECGAPDVPSFSCLRRKQEKMFRDMCLAPEHHTSSLGNHFFVNHPAKLLALRKSQENELAFSGMLLVLKY
ncbi:hypothetical protein PTI98_003511 [Pleurotus ostreatus]|nr:hypothetical protein PTI98_003511 [Pleurotus ostreatus]